MLRGACLKKSVMCSAGIKSASAAHLPFPSIGRRLDSRNKHNKKQNKKVFSCLKFDKLGEAEIVTGLGPLYQSRGSPLCKQCVVSCVVYLGISFTCMEYVSKSFRRCYDPKRDVAQYIFLVCLYMVIMIDLEIRNFKRRAVQKTVLFGQ